MPPQLGEHFFRHEYGRLVAMLSRRVGMRHLEIVEDAVQCALLAAIEFWTKGSVPENPSAWLFRVAHNQLAGELRKRARRERLVAQRGLEDSDATATGPIGALTGDVGDDLLRVLFVCWLASSTMWMAVLADLYRRCGNVKAAQRYRDAALRSAPSTAVRDLLKRRLRTISGYRRGRGRRRRHGGAGRLKPGLPA